MSKMRTDSNWAKITAEQREILEGWLFVEKMSYREVAERAEKEFGVKASAMSVSRYYWRANEKRTLEGMEASLNTGYQIMSRAPDGIMYDAITIRLLEYSAYKLALEGPERMNLKKISWLMTTLLQYRRQKTREHHVAISLKQMETEGMVKMSELAHKLSEKRAERAAEEPIADELMEKINALSKDLFKDGGLKSLGAKLASGNAEAKKADAAPGEEKASV